MPNSDQWCTQNTSYRVHHNTPIREINEKMAEFRILDKKIHRNAHYDNHKCSYQPSIKQIYGASGSRLPLWTNHQIHGTRIKATIFQLQLILNWNILWHFVIKLFSCTFISVSATILGSIWNRRQINWINSHTMRLEWVKMMSFPSAVESRIEK